MMREFEEEVGITRIAWVVTGYQGRKEFEGLEQTLYLICLHGGKALEEGKARLWDWKWRQ